MLPLMGPACIARHRALHCNRAPAERGNHRWGGSFATGKPRAWGAALRRDGPGGQPYLHVPLPLPEVLEKLLGFFAAFVEAKP